MNYAQNNVKKSSVGIIQWIALIVLVAAMFSASKRAVLPALVAILRFAWPFFAIWLLWRFIKHKVKSAMGKFQEQVMQAAQQPGMGGSGAFGASIRNAARKGSQENVIDLCPKCGVLLAANHECEKRK